MRNFVINITNADTEYSHTLSNNCTGFTFQERSGNVIRFSFVPNTVATSTDPYCTLKANQAYTRESAGRPVKFGGLTIYFAAGASSRVVELVEMES
jgi:hypothetical protein